MEKRFATAFAMNGSAAIHDFEIALAGCTSEDVEAVLPDGRFGSAGETGLEMNTAIHDGGVDGIGAGEALGRLVGRRRQAALLRDRERALAAQRLERAGVDVLAPGRDLVAVQLLAMAAAAAIDADEVVVARRGLRACDGRREQRKQARDEGETGEGHAVLRERS